MPQSPHPLVAAGAIALAVTACGSAAMQPNTPSGNASGAPAHERPNETQRGAKPPVPRRNPQAVAYEVTFDIRDAPGPFADVHASFGYDVSSPLCLPRLGGMSGTRVDAHQSFDVALEQIGPSTYRGIVYDDLLVDEDYYGLGVCHWALTSVGIGFSATGAKGETRFSEGMLRDKLVALTTQRSYFERRFYPRAAIDDMPVGGVRDIGRFKPEVRNDLFSLEISAKRDRP